MGRLADFNQVRRVVEGGVSGGVLQSGAGARGDDLKLNCTRRSSGTKLILGRGMRKGAVDMASKLWDCILRSRTDTQLARLRVETVIECGGLTCVAERLGF